MEIPWMFCDGVPSQIMMPYMIYQLYFCNLIKNRLEGAGGGNDFLSNPWSKVVKNKKHLVFLGNFIL